MAHRSPFINGPGGTPETSDIREIRRTAADVAEAESSVIGSEPIHRAPTPFVWQHGRRLLLLDDEQRGWVMAELRFDVERCRYVEVRRATYRWPREAFGAVLSRALASGVDAAEDSARSLETWLGKYYDMGQSADA